MPSRYRLDCSECRLSSQRTNPSPSHTSLQLLASQCLDQLFLVDYGLTHWPLPTWPQEENAFDVENQRFRGGLPSCVNGCVACRRKNAEPVATACTNLDQSGRANALILILGKKKVCFRTQR